jgi:FtsH-binding integral membrane protein
MENTIFVSQNVRQETKNFFKKVYLWMFLGLSVSGATAFFVASSPWLVLAIIGNSILLDKKNVCRHGFFDVYFVFIRQRLDAFRDFYGF